MLYAMGHFSKFLPLGSQRVRMSLEKIDDNGFYAIAFKRPDGGNSVIIISTRKQWQTVTLDDPDFAQINMQIEPNSFNSWIYYNWLLAKFS